MKSIDLTTPTRLSTDVSTCSRSLLCWRDQDIHCWSYPSTPQALEIRLYRPATLRSVGPFVELHIDQRSTDFHLSTLGSSTTLPVSHFIYSIVVSCQIGRIRCWLSISAKMLDEVLANPRESWLCTPSRLKMYPSIASWPPRRFLGPSTKWVKDLSICR